MRFLLASASPRRSELLRAAGFDFDVRATEVDERVLAGESPDAYVLRLASAKASAASRDGSDRLIVGADTSVVVDGDILGKAADQDEARGMLRRLAGREHVVLTGVALWRGGYRDGFVERTAVRFAPLDPDEIEWYVSTGEWHDKAGAYAIQGSASRLIVGITGSYTNVVGFPIARFHQALKQLRRLDALPTRP